MAKRPDDDTIRLLREVLEEIGTNEAIAGRRDGLRDHDPLR